MGTKSRAVDLFQIHMRELGLSLIREYKFHPNRKWAFDFALACGKSDVLGGRRLKVGFEIDGGVYSRGRHTRGAGYEEDIRKYTEAMILGWQVIRFSTGMVDSGEAKELMRRWVNAVTK